MEVKRNLTVKEYRRRQGSVGWFADPEAHLSSLHPQRSRTIAGAFRRPLDCRGEAAKAAENERIRKEARRRWSAPATSEVTEVAIGPGAERTRAQELSRRNPGVCLQSQSTNSERWNLERPFTRIAIWRLARICGSMFGMTSCSVGTPPSSARSKYSRHGSGNMIG
jgi:hypothetical protein